MTEQDFYSQHSPFTNPDDYAKLYNTIPDDIQSICRAVQGLLVHYVADGYQPPSDRLREIDTRYTKGILARILELDDQPLTTPRSIEKRLVGCCRDYSVLTVSILRHKGIPARVRYGTGAYFEPSFYGDHAILEYWNGDRWVAVDSEMSPKHIQRHGITFDVFDVPDDQFVRGGRGWLMCRKEGADPNQFGIASSIPIRGLVILLTEMMLDLASLNRFELLCWDSWGFAANFGALIELDKLFFDDVAEATLDNNRFTEWQVLFEHDKLAIPNTIRSYSPAVPLSEHPVTVHLDLKS